MADLMFSLNVVFPLLVIMAVGYAARLLHVIGPTGVREANRAVFRIFLPLLLFFNIYDTRIDSTADVRTLLFALVGSVAVFGAMFLLAPLLTDRRGARGVLIQGVARSNYAIFGIPLVMAIYPNADVSIASLMVVVAVPVFNICSVIALMLYGSEERPSLKKTLLGVATNPLIIATALGILCSCLRLPLPDLLCTPLRSLGKLASPLALFLLGASLNFRQARADARLLTLGVLGRLVVVPGVMLTAAALLGIRDVALATLVAAFASPTSVSSYPMAQQMGGDDSLAGGLVVFTTVFSILTVFVIILLLRRLGLLA